ncbi:hypothetical protein LPJ59_006244 [Coemansia sp. RSA 2399]|nr:hypothetical protein LPJ59_006244 [Coemansia sp. RSA 2399]KAJ1905044.1 hypothetical protein LPJ81_002145 [Coemansia sp. IMI 209127]
MKLTTVVVLAAALATASVASDTPPNHSPGRFPKRDANLLERIRANVRDAVGDLQDLLGGGSTVADDTATAADSAATESSSSSSSSSSRHKSSSAAATSDSSDSSDSSVSSSSSATSTKSSNDKSSSSSATSSSETPTSTGEPCSDTDSVVCDAATVGQYSTCDGSMWQTGSCANNDICSIVNNAAVCINSADTAQTAAPSDYTLISPSAFVPESAATLKAKAAMASVTAALALALAAASWGF